MLKFDEKQIQEMKQELGANTQEITNILRRVLTVGDLKKALEGVDENLPVELEVVLEITPEGDCAAQPGLLIHHYQVEAGDDGYPRLTLVGAQPQNAEAYAESFELDALKQ